MLSSDAIKIVDEFAAAEVGFQDELKIKLFSDYTFTAGDKQDIHLTVCRGDEEKEVSDAKVMVKVLGSAFRPMIFHARTDEQGVAKVSLKLPVFRAGRAAILIRAIKDSEETELRRIIMHK